MPVVTFQKGGETFTAEVPDNANLVVRAGIKKFPWPHLRYGCGMGKCAKCACRVLDGAAHLPPPNWKEDKQLGARLAQGYRLVCQIWLTHDVALAQDDAPLPPAGGS
ncbi:MAG: ferredoxin [Belnapia sp.]|nr:ferredoxin [Belnapia sp.]